MAADFNEPALRHAALRCARWGTAAPSPRFAPLQPLGISPAQRAPPPGLLTSLSSPRYFVTLCALPISAPPSICCDFKQPVPLFLPRLLGMRAGWNLGWGWWGEWDGAGGGRQNIGRTSLSRCFHRPGVAAGILPLRHGAEERCGSSITPCTSCGDTHGKAAVDRR